jgi:hypothetical protein
MQRRAQHSHSSRAPADTERGAGTRAEPAAYRPTAPGKPKIVFQETPSERTYFRTDKPTADEVPDLRDAYSGVRLDPSRPIWQCARCQVCYHGESIELLRRQNDGQCVSCRSREIYPIPGDSAKSSDRSSSFRPDIVTLLDYRNHIGRVVTFEGYVLDIRPSRGGESFAAMFELGPWTESLKLVFLSRYLERAGGQDFISSLLRRNVRVRGLLVRHPIFGYQILVTDQSMIMSIR